MRSKGILRIVRCGIRKTYVLLKVFRNTIYFFVEWIVEETDAVLQALLSKLEATSTTTTEGHHQNRQNHRQNLLLHDASQPNLLYEFFCSGNSGLELNEERTETSQPGVASKKMSRKVGDIKRYQALPLRSNDILPGVLLDDSNKVISCDLNETIVMLYNELPDKRICNASNGSEGLLEREIRDISPETLFRERAPQNKFRVTRIIMDNADLHENVIEQETELKPLQKSESACNENVVQVTDQIAMDSPLASETDRNGSPDDSYVEALESFNEKQIIPEFKCKLDDAIESSEICPEEEIMNTQGENNGLEERNILRTSSMLEKFNSTEIGKTIA